MAAKEPHDKHDPLTTDDLLVNSSVSINENVLTSNIITQLSDMSDSIITSLSNSELNATGNIITPHGSIIITNEGIVFPPGTLMIANPGAENLQQNTSLSESLNDDSVNDNGEFDIKVESNALKPSSLATYKVETNPDENSTNPNFSINQNVLQNIPDSDTDLQQITFSNGDHITQFHIQMPLSITDLQNLQKINRNVLMSQAALPEDSKGLEGENIIIERSGKHAFLTSTSSLDHGDNKTVIVHDDTKQYLAADTNFSTDEAGNLIIKNESSSVSGNVIQGEASYTNAVKSETVLAAVNQSEQLSDGNTSYQQIMYVQVENGTPTTLLPVSGTNDIIQSDLHSVQKPEEIQVNDAKKKRKGRKPRVTKPVNIMTREADISEKIQPLRTLAPRLLSLPLYAGAQAGIGIGKTLLKPYNLATMQIIEGGQYFEVLGRCTQCFRFSRTTTYCRAEKNHRDPKSSVCLECEAAGLSTVVCRRKLNHTAPNAQPLNIVINTALQNAEHVKQLCIRNYLPPCFGELHSIVIHHADITFVAQRYKHNEGELVNSDLLAPMPLPRKPTDYARGYLYPYNKEKWEEWLVKYCHQTGTNYRIRTGKRVNKKTDHGLANHNGKIVPYRTLETQLYNCALGGKPRKRKMKDGIKKRKERGSKLIGCPAVIHTRLLETEYEWRALEITVPKILAHLPCHDPRNQPPTAEDLVEYNELLLSQINPTQMQQVAQDIDSEQQQRFDFVQVVGDENEELNRKKDSAIIDVKKNTKNLLLTCASLVDTIDNLGALLSVQENSQMLLNKLIKDAAATKQPAPKRVKRKKEFLEQNSVEAAIEIDSVTSNVTLNQMGINILTSVS